MDRQRLHSELSRTFVAGKALEASWDQCEELSFDVHVIPFRGCVVSFAMPLEGNVKGGVRGTHCCMVERWFHMCAFDEAVSCSWS